MLRLAKHLLVATLFVVFAGCAGGGCSSGCSCGGVTPLAEGFDPARRIENTGALRITDSGLAFLSQNLGPLAGLLIGNGEGGGVIEFEIPTSGGDLGCFEIGNVFYTICPDGPNAGSDPKECVAEIDVEHAVLTLTTAPNHNLLVDGTLPIRLQKLPFDVDAELCLPFTGCDVCTGFDVFAPDITMTGNQSCPGQAQTFHDVLLNVNVSIEIDPDMAHSRFGYSRVRVGIDVDDDNLLSGLKVCTGSGLGDDVINGLIGSFAGGFIGQIEGTLNEQLEEALCQQANPALTPSCPTGTFDVDGICRFGMAESDECASIVLGLDGNIDLEGALASFSPGTKGAFDFLFAAGGHSDRMDGSGFHFGDLNPIGGGATLGLYGGWEPRPVSGCVTPVDVPLPSGIPIPDELTQNTVPNWPTADGPHVGIAISERFTNYLLAQAYNSGALCLGITADALGEGVPLTSALVGTGLGADSLAELARLKRPAPLAILLRPGAPPTMEFGAGTNIETDPLMRLAIPKLSFDFYVFSLDRYVRAMTATMDLDIPLNLEVTPDGLVPVIEALGVSNAEVTNSGLLREDPAAIAAALQELLGSLVGGFLGDALPPVDISGPLADLGLSLEIPPTVEGEGSPGLTLLTKGSDDFLGIFATLGLASSMANFAPDQAADPPTSTTTAEITAVDVDPEGLRAGTMTPENGPRVTLQLGSNLDNGTRKVEWQYKLDKGPWHPFSTNRRVEVSDPWLRTHGRHTVFVRSRVVGDARSLDPQPLALDVLIDDAAPKVRVVEGEDGKVRVEAKDEVTRNVEVRVRYAAFEGGALAWRPWSEWTVHSQLAALDPADDITFVEVEARDETGRVGTVSQPLIRGRADGAGCDCAVPARDAGPRAAWLWLLVGAAAVFLRRRKAARRRAKALELSAALSVMLVAGSFSGCSCGEDVAAPVDPGCRGRGDCKVMVPGLVGSYSSVAVAGDGTVWVSGYLEAAWAGEQFENQWGGDYEYGDLAVGKWDAAAQEVDWQVVDGLPPDAVPDLNLYDPLGFRGGVIDSGPDVGLWTSIQVDGGGNPAVAYYDASARALKYASFDGAAWQIVTVQSAAAADVGRYAKLVFVGGLPVIAYMFIEPAASGTINSGVRVARGSAVAAGGASWTFEDVAVEAATPCHEDLCPEDTVCAVESNTCLSESVDCPSKCEDGFECVLVGSNAQCQEARGAPSAPSYPDASGLYVSLDTKPNGSLGLVFYDRIHGNLWAASNDGGTWTTAMVDGEDAGVDTGDKGLGASLDIDENGDFHVVYVDGLAEAVNYRVMTGGVTPGPVEVVDDGLGFGDGQHVVGDDADIIVQNGEIRIAYQDATAGQLRYAQGTGMPGMHSWSVSAVDQPGFAGAFSTLVDIGGQQQIMNFWREASPWSQGNVRLLTP
jgi:hypothetical protein